jgi:large subunit ribosomal protein L21
VRSVARRIGTWAFTLEPEPGLFIFTGWITAYFREISMYAVFRTGGKQFRAEPGLHLKVPTLDAEPGDTVTFDDVLIASDGDTVQVGSPVVDGAQVKAEVVGHGKDQKIIVFKRKRRKGYRRKQGHRQKFTEIRVDQVVL